MAGTGDNILDKLLHRRAMRRWARASRETAKSEISSVRNLRQQARQLRTQLNRFIQMADERVDKPLVGSTSTAAPHDSDWTWRPELWRSQLTAHGMASAQSESTLGSEVELFHDCKLAELSMRQLRNQRLADLAPYSLCMEVFKFDGSFLSIAIDLPDDAAKGLKRSHLLRIDTVIKVEKPLQIFARLNIKQGPNLEQIVRELPMDNQDLWVEFDLLYTKLNEKRLEKAWIDLIFEDPELNQFVIYDFTVSRRPRAPL
ncbi:MAG: DUF6478 family protein [Paracoccaceae bacterium]